MIAKTVLIVVLKITKAEKLCEFNDSSMSMRVSGHV